MSAQKTNKSFAKRLKLTKTGKVKVRKGGKGHFNAKQSGTKQITGKVPADLKLSKKAVNRNLPH